MPSVTIEKTIRFAEGESGEFRIEPRPEHPCRVVIELGLPGSGDWHVMSGANADGDPVPSPDRVGNFHQVGHAHGRITLRNDGADAEATLRMTVICEDSDLDADDFSITSDTGPTPSAVGASDTDWFDLLFGGWIKFFKRVWEELDKVFDSLNFIVFFWLILVGPFYLLWKIFERIFGKDR